ncbi:STAS domain-containing protein [Micromonosporaceae bacterium B7E4]
MFIDGELDIARVPRFGAVLDAVIDQRPAHVVIDLAACRHVDAAGISLLLDAHRRLMRSGGQVTLRQPSTRVRRILRIARLHNVLRMEPPEPVEGSAAPAGERSTAVVPAEPDLFPSPSPGERVAGPVSVRTGPATRGDLEPGPHAEDGERPGPDQGTAGRDRLERTSARGEHERRTRDSR